MLAIQNPTKLHRYKLASANGSRTGVTNTDRRTRITTQPGHRSATGFQSSRSF
jgi:hypothetical protein